MLRTMFELELNGECPFCGDRAANALKYIERSPSRIVFRLDFVDELVAAASLPMVAIRGVDARRLRCTSIACSRSTPSGCYLVEKRVSKQNFC